MNERDVRLFHFSDAPAIREFVPRPVRVPSVRPPGMEWLNGPLVWAIEERRQYMYLFPRDCPRIVIWPTSDSSIADRQAWIGDHAAAVYLEESWRQRFENASIVRYEWPSETFEDLNDAGMWVSRERVIPIAEKTITDLPAALQRYGADVRYVPSLEPLKPLWQSTLHVSGIRLRHAAGWS